jgi:hypothetical protein
MLPGVTTLLLLLLACPAPDPGAAPTGSRSAELAQRAAEVGRRADVLAERTREIEGLYDALRAAPFEQRAALRARIRERAEALRDEAVALEDEVERIERSAQVY